MLIKKSGEGVGCGGPGGPRRDQVCGPTSTFNASLQTNGLVNCPQAKFRPQTAPRHLRRCAPPNPGQYKQAERSTSAPPHAWRQLANPKITLERVAARRTWRRPPFHRFAHYRSPQQMIRRGKVRSTATRRRRRLPAGAVVDDLGELEIAAAVDRAVLGKATVQ